MRKPPALPYPYRREVIDYGRARYAKVVMDTPIGDCVVRQRLTKKTTVVPERTWRALERLMRNWQSFDEAQ